MNYVKITPQDLQERQKQVKGLRGMMIILMSKQSMRWVSVCWLRGITRAASFAVCFTSDFARGLQGASILCSDYLWMIEAGKACRDMLIVFAIPKALTAQPSQYFNPFYPSEAETESLLIVNLVIVLWPWASKILKRAWLTYSMVWQTTVQETDTWE